MKITDEHGTKFFWVSDLERRDGKVYGPISNEPEFVASVKYGDRMELPTADVSDWRYTRSGRLVGNYTARALLKHMPVDRAEKVRSMLADP